MSIFFLNSFCCWKKWGKKNLKQWKILSIWFSYFTMPGQMKMRRNQKIPSDKNDRTIQCDTVNLDVKSWDKIKERTRIEDDSRNVEFFAATIFEILPIFIRQAKLSHRLITNKNTKVYTSSDVSDKRLVLLRVNTNIQSRTPKACIVKLSGNRVVSCMGTQKESIYNLIFNSCSYYYHYYYFKSAWEATIFILSLFFVFY